jgi:hypothetical protein
MSACHVRPQLVQQCDREEKIGQYLESLGRRYSSKSNFGSKGHDRGGIQEAFHKKGSIQDSDLDRCLNSIEEKLASTNVDHSRFTSSNRDMDLGDDDGSEITNVSPEALDAALFCVFKRKCWNAFLNC